MHCCINANNAIAVLAWSLPYNIYAYLLPVAARWPPATCCFCSKRWNCVCICMRHLLPVVTVVQLVARCKLLANTPYIHCIYCWLSFVCFVFFFFIFLHCFDFVSLFSALVLFANFSRHLPVRHRLAPACCNSCFLCTLFTIHIFIFLTA